MNLSLSEGNELYEAAQAIGLITAIDPKVVKIKPESEK